MKLLAGKRSTQRYRKLFFALALSSSLSVALFLFRVIDSSSYRYGFLQWNLFLAWLPLLFAWRLAKSLHRYRWLSWKPLILTILWLGFLPNSFYIISDLIHLQPTGEVNILYDTVLFVSFIWNGLVLGFISLYLIHHQLLARLAKRRAHNLIALVLLLCSFAIYLGRYLRWNSWDIILHPAGLIFDVSESFINPISNPQIFVTTLTFFVVLGSMYVIVWQLVGALRYD